MLVLSHRFTSFLLVCFFECPETRCLSLNNSLEKTQRPVKIKYILARKCDLFLCYHTLQAPWHQNKIILVFNNQCHRHPLLLELTNILSTNHDFRASEYM